MTLVTIRIYGPTSYPDDIQMEVYSQSLNQQATNDTLRPHTIDCHALTDQAFAFQEKPACLFIVKYPLE